MQMLRKLGVLAAGIALGLSGAIFIASAQTGGGGVQGGGGGNLATATGVLARTKGGTGLTTSADDTVIVGNGTIYQAKTVPDCTDTGGNHLNYTQSTNVISCGTSGGGGGQTTGTGTLTYADAFTTDLTQTYSWSLTGVLVSITFTQNVSGTSDSVNFVSDALPANLRPARIQQFITLVGTGSVANGCVRFSTDGTVHLILVTQTVPLQCNVTANDGWTASGTKAFYANVGVSPSVGVAGPTFVYTTQ